MDDSKASSKWKKLVWKKLYNTIYMTFWKTQTIEAVNKSIGASQKFVKGEATGDFCLGSETIQADTVIADTQRYEFFKLHWIL